MNDVEREDLVYLVGLLLGTLEMVTQELCYDSQILIDARLKEVRKVLGNDH